MMTERICPVCGGPIITTTAGRPPKFCSRICQVAGYRRKDVGGVLTTVRLPTGLHTALRLAADDRDVSLVWLIRKLLAEGVERLDPELRLTHDDEG